MTSRRTTKVPVKGVLHRVIIANPLVFTPDMEGKGEALKSSSHDPLEKPMRRPVRWGRSPCPNDHLNKHHGDVSTEQKFKDLDARIDAINSVVNSLVTVDALIRKTEPHSLGG